MQGHEVNQYHFLLLSHHYQLSQFSKSLGVCFTIDHSGTIKIVILKPMAIMVQLEPMKQNMDGGSYWLILWSRMSRAGKRRDLIFYSVTSARAYNWICPIPSAIDWSCSYLTIPSMSSSATCSSCIDGIADERTSKRASKAYEMSTWSADVISAA